MEVVGASDPNAYTVLASEKLKWSYAGRLGSAIEPVLEPLGFDWKIGIALVTSFAAREVFVGTMSTIYSVDGGEEDVMTIREKMRAEINPSNGKPRYDLPTGIGLMLFYAFALQCMSTFDPRNHVPNGTSPAPMAHRTHGRNKKEHAGGR